MGPKKKGGESAAPLIGIGCKKNEDFAGWYGEVVTKGNFMQYTDISGCYIFEPPSYSVWEQIQGWFNRRIKKDLGVRNCYFPMFITKKNLEREQEHVEGFSAEVAWVTHGGTSKLEEPIAIRPTSETAMYGYFANRIRSHRDLPLRLNQWNSVVRWEFKNPQPFLRTREFLWQEGHTAHLTKESAAEEVLQILELYAGIYEQLLAVPVVRGTKTKNEQFPGADYTTTVEGFIPATGRGIQGGTSHCLGQHFSRREMFNITVEDPSQKDGEEKKPPIHVWQNSWGFTTRSIGVMIMLHGDDKGLVVPPRVSETQVVIVPAGLKASTSEEDRKRLYKEVGDMATTLRNTEYHGDDIRVELDLREGYSPPWKYNDWELKGVPLRLEVGFKDLEKRVVTAARRDLTGKDGAKSEIPISDLAKKIPDLLDTIQTNLYETAEKAYSEHRKLITKWDDFVPALNDKNVCLIPHCLEGDCEDQIKEMSARKPEENSAPEDARAPSMGAKSLCIPFKQPSEIKDVKCTNPHCGRSAEKWVMFGRSY